MIFGEDGNLYVSSFNNDRVLRYDGTTGAYIDTFVSDGAGGLNGPDAGMTFGPDGHLYVPSFFNRRVLKYDGKTGASLGAFIANAAGELRNPRTVVFRTNGTVLVTSQGTNQILLYNSKGKFIRKFINPNYTGTTGLAVSPIDGNVYAASLNVGNVRRFNGTDGSWEGVAVNVGSGGLDLPVFISFHTDPNLRLKRMSPGTINAFNSMQVQGGTPGNVQAWLIGTTLGSVPFPTCPHMLMGIVNPFVKLRMANAAGNSRISATLGNDLLGTTIGFQVYEPVSCRLSNLVVQTIE